MPSFPAKTKILLILEKPLEKQKLNHFPSALLHTKLRATPKYCDGSQANSPDKHTPTHRPLHPPQRIRRAVGRAKLCHNKFLLLFNKQCHLDIDFRTKDSVRRRICTSLFVMLANGYLSSLSRPSIAKFSCKIVKNLIAYVKFELYCPFYCG